MAMLTLPLSVQPSCLNCRTTESSKLIVARHNIYGEKVKCRLANSDLKRKLLYREGGEISRKRSSQIFCSQVSAVLRNSGEKTKQKLSTYLFRTEIGDGQVKVLVAKKKNKYVVNIEVSSLQLCTDADKLVLSWGIFRSDSSNAIAKPSETPFVHKSVGRFTLLLEFEAKQAPFNISFLLKAPIGVDSKGSEIRSHRNTSFCVPVGFNSGHPTPLGLSFTNNGSINFALLSRNAENVVLCLYDKDSVDQPALELDLDPYVNRTGDIWHASMDSGAAQFASYGYRCKGKEDRFHSKRVLLDPYAKIIENYASGGIGSVLVPSYLGRLQKQPDFDWTGDVRPFLPMEKLAVYRLNVMHFTKDKSSELPSSVAGTFSGLTEKVSHFKDIGVNAVLLEPIFPFDEQKGPYFPCHFFSPTNLYGPSSGPVPNINSMKEMVKKLHANGIEVLLEVVFTQTAEDGSLQAIDNSSYYINVDVGSRNALNCNYPIVQQLILDSLRHWVTEFHVDGFCFINASSLVRGFHGEHLSRPPLVEAITFDPILAKTKIIADSWDTHDMMWKEIRFPHWKRWAEMNSKFCHDVRNFLRGKGLLSDIATRLCGSGDIFSDGRGPAFSFNFIARNSGLPLVDLVSFSSGSKLASQLSWNCGEEGPTNNSVVLETRVKQIRNYLFILFVSLGVPVLNMGDECGQSSGGSPLYGDRRTFNWNALSTNFGTQITQFISFLGSFRVRRGDIFQRREFLKVENIDWHGTDQSPPRWDDALSKFLAMRLTVEKGKNEAISEFSQTRGDLFIVFNAGLCAENVILPLPPAGMLWLRLVDTSLSFPGFFSMDDGAVLQQMDRVVAYEVKSHSCVLFEARPISI